MRVAGRRRSRAGRGILRADRSKQLKACVMSFLQELWAFMLARKKFWLFPVLFFMLVFGGLVVLSQGSAVAPFIYTIF